MSREPAVFLRHIMLCLGRINDYTREGREAFLRDTRTQDAVVRNLEIIGQAVRDLGVDKLAAEFPSVRWRQIAGLRNVLAHQYLGVDLGLTWNVIERELSPLRDAIEALLSRQDSGQDSQ